MGYLAMDRWCTTKLSNLPSPPYLHLGRKSELPYFQSVQPTRFFAGFHANGRVYASKGSPKRVKKAKESQKIVKPQLTEGPPDEPNGPADKPSPTDSINNLESQASIAIASRSSVIQACTVTSGLIAFLGVIIREGSHLASSQGWPIVDCSSEISFNFETWHLQLVAGLVILVSSSRFLLLKMWSDFAVSSEASNQQVLTSLEPLDYAFVAFLPGMSEELLFRGALIPLFGTNLTSVTAVAAIFGILHLGNGRKFSFAIWATFVGLAYGYAAILSSSLLVPMASHAINNLIGGVIWRVSQPNNLKKEGAISALRLMTWPAILVIVIADDILRCHLRFPLPPIEGVSSEIKKELSS